MMDTDTVKLIHIWQALEETHGHLYDQKDTEDRVAISVIRSTWEAMDDLVRHIWEERNRP